MRHYHNNFIYNQLTQQLNFMVLDPHGYIASPAQQNHYQWTGPIFLVPATPPTSSASWPISTPNSSPCPRAIVGRRESTSSPVSSNSSWSFSSGSSPSSTSYFPLNPSLDEDIQERLGLTSKPGSQGFSASKTSTLDEFRRMGRDYEYCPEDPDFAARRKAIQKLKKKNKKPLATECVFCRNNNEPPSVYRSHILKNEDGDVVCPILSQYICDYCGATGKHAHTRMYCSKRNNVEIPAPKSFQIQPNQSFHRRLNF